MVTWHSNRSRAVTGMRGQVMLLHPPEAPCLRCLLPERPQVGTRDIGDHRDRVRAGWVHSGEALKHLTGLGASLLGTLLVIDAESMLFERIRLIADPPVRSVADARPFPAGEAAASGPRPDGPVEIRPAAARPGGARLCWIPDSVSNGQRLDRREAGARHHTRPTPSAPSPSFALAVCAPPKATQTSSMRLLQPSPRTPAPDCASPARVASASCSSPHRNLQRLLAEALACGLPVIATRSDARSRSSPMQTASSPRGRRPRTRRRSAHHARAVCMLRFGDIRVPPCSLQ